MNKKNLILAACAVVALGAMTAGEAVARHRRLGGGNTGYSSGGYDYSIGYRGHGNNDNNRSQVGYGHNSGYGASFGYNGYSNDRHSPSLGFGHSRNHNSRSYAGYGNDNARSGYGTRYDGNSGRQPVAYRHGNHVDVGDGNGGYHVPGSRRRLSQNEIQRGH